MSHQVRDNVHAAIKNQKSTVHLLDLATRSSSSFFLIAYELDEPYSTRVKSHTIYRRNIGNKAVRPRIGWYKWMRFKSIFCQKKSSDLNHTYFHIFQFILCCKASHNETLINYCLLTFCSARVLLEIAVLWRTCCLCDRADRPVSKIKTWHKNTNLKKIKIWFK